jgi:DNA repair exonuclease SbcCD ATPase subunit
MSNELIFYTQIASLLAFITSLFVLYKLLISQKDATIETLRERLTLEKDRSTIESADKLAEALNKRVNMLGDELERLKADKETNSEVIKLKENELTEAKNTYQRLQKMVMHTSGMSVSYFCPECDEPTISETETKLRFHNREPDYFLVKYSCGYSELNGNKASECNKTKILR